jgi:hypothetical protein
MMNETPESFDSAAALFPAEIRFFVLDFAGCLLLVRKPKKMENHERAAELSRCRSTPGAP